MDYVKAPGISFMYLKENLEAVGFEPATDVDPCLFISEKVICLTYADDCIMVARDIRASTSHDVTSH